MARYSSTNELSTFMFHDSQFTGAEFCGSDMIWYVGSVDVTEGNTQNKSNYPMSIIKPKITFSNYRFVDFYHENTGYVKPMLKAELLALFDDEPIYFSYLFPSEVKLDKVRCADAELILPDSLKEFSVEYTDILIEWDEYWGKAHWVI